MRPDYNKQPKEQRHTYPKQHPAPSQAETGPQAKDGYRPIQQPSIEHLS